MQFDLYFISEWCLPLNCYDVIPVYQMTNYLLFNQLMYSRIALNIYQRVIYNYEYT